jgi:hypothetical protein
LALSGYRQLVSSVDHSFALSNPALVSVPLKKINFQRLFPDLRMQYLQIRLMLAFASRRASINYSAARSSRCRFHSVTWFG